MARRPIRTGRLRPRLGCRVGRVPVKATPYNQKTIAEFQAKQGRGVGMWGDHVLLMTAKGARSGEAITTPLVYGREGDDYVIVASQGGSPKHPIWFGNIKAYPEVYVEVSNGD